MKILFQPRDFKNLRDFCGLRVWQKPKDFDVYAIGVDVAEGIGGDASVASVINCTTGLHVATYWSNTIDVDNYTVDLVKLGNWYNKAYINPECNNHGHAVISLLGGSVGSFAYPNLYRRYEMDAYTAKRTKVIGYKTTRQTKPRLIENLKSAFKCGDLYTYDRYTIQELGCFVRDERNGALSAKGNAHDDRVMALALAWEQARLLRDGLVESKTSSSINQKYDPMTGFPMTGEYEESFFTG